MGDSRPLTRNGPMSFNCHEDASRGKADRGQMENGCTRMEKPSKGFPGWSRDHHRPGESSVLWQKQFPKLLRKAGLSSDWQCPVDGGKRFEEAGWDGKPKEIEFPHPDLGEYQHMDAT